LYQGTIHSSPPNPFHPAKIAALFIDLYDKSKASKPCNIEGSFLIA
jgi:hypothetical protein